MRPALGRFGRACLLSRREVLVSVCSGREAASRCGGLPRRRPGGPCPLPSTSYRYPSGCRRREFNSTMVFHQITKITAGITCLAQKKKQKIIEFSKSHWTSVRIKARHPMP
ncbi:hypothetical protein EVAR_103544_1 [Eumeta japonica]|uniref:Uncharacterized protein n=1 Tax=Eumeta variegata TaxID=151549 RepID=A0A4C1YEB1_EUMVA|nr:hypothetical protein EVAR_103544_1 [Eumeta japonica]